MPPTPPWFTCTWNIPVHAKTAKTLQIPINDEFTVYHGNNGIRAVPLPDGTLTITKKAVNGEKAEISEFEFTIALTRASLDEIKTD